MFARQPAIEDCCKDEMCVKMYEYRKNSVIYFQDVLLDCKQVQAQTLPGNATPPVGKIHPFSKIVVTFEPIHKFALQDLESLKKCQ